MRAFVTLTAAFIGISIAAPAISAQIPGTRVPGGCDVPAAQRPNVTGCYLVARQTIDTLPDGPLYWHIYQRCGRGVDHDDHKLDSQRTMLSWRAERSVDHGVVR